MKWLPLKRPLIIGGCILLVELFFNVLSLIRVSTPSIVAATIMNSLLVFSVLIAFFLALREERNLDYMAPVAADPQDSIE